MQSFKWDGYKSIEETVEELLGSEDPILLSFDVIPLDYLIEDILSPKVFLTRYRLILVVDRQIEIYNLREFLIWVLGGKPNFALTHQVLESRIDYQSSDTPLSKNIDIPDDLVRFAIMEKNTLQKEFVLRKGKYPVKAYQTWAFAQFLRNLQIGHEDYRLRNMVYGGFSFFDGVFLVGAFLIFLLYVFVSIVFGSLLPELLILALDSLFALVCLGVLVWTFWTIFVNMREYRKVYEEYRIKGLRKAPAVQK